MSKLKLTGKQIRAIGYEEGPVVSVAMHTTCTHFKHQTEEEALQILKDVLASPENYLADEVLCKIAEKLVAVPEEKRMEIPLTEKGIHYNVFGAKHTRAMAYQSAGYWPPTMPSSPMR